MLQRRLQKGLITIFWIIIENAGGEILTPPYFNLAEGKEITASATCGVDTPGPELYCKLVGANADQAEDINLIQGQVCDVCDPNNSEKRHPPEYAVDGMETWWQSPPLSRGMKYNEVSLTINLGQPFHVAYVFLRMGNSPRPGLWVLEKSKDYGKTWSPWQYFSDSAADCITFFGVDSNTPITRDDSVICTTEYSHIVPLEGGEIPISILNSRPSAKHYFNSTLLQEWTRATTVRFRFLRTKNFLGHLMSVARQDATVTRRYFYSVKDINIGGRCMCNGHAESCDITDPKTPKMLICGCQHNTCGQQCDTCCRGFEQKKWQQSTAVKKFTCEPCNCFGHSDECGYDQEIDTKHLSLDIYGNYEGGGVCKNCRHNTEGINCHLCQPKFYRPFNKPLNATDVCQPCNCNYLYSTGNCAELTGKCECRKEFTPPDCDSCNYGYFGFPNCKPCECNLKGTEGYHCEATDGYCPCKPNYAGHYCNLCAEGYYDFPECLSCQCNPVGALSEVCEVVSGNCTCKNNYDGRTCDICEDGYYNYPSCSYCNCDARGTESGICDKRSGTCLCKEGYGGARCDQCVSGYYGYPNCRPCNCSSNGSSSISCDITGKCGCLGNFAGKTCDQCSPGFYQYPECINCNCNSHGSIGISCDAEGKCRCNENFDSSKCEQCKEGFYNFPRCEGCNCDPAGIVETFQGCGSLPAGELCQCKKRVEGRICNQCKPLYWNLQQYNREGCEDCQCNLPGVIGGIGECDTRTGQCICKPGVTERSCSKCVDGTYNLQDINLFGCSDCACDIGGSINSLCDKSTGQCQCQARISGLRCNEPLQAHYFPTLHQFRYEAEDGRTPNQSPVRYQFSEDLFPGFSWKGYAVFSALQDEIILLIDVQKSSLYRMILRYVNPNEESILGTITITPENPSEVEQQFKVHFKNTTRPAFVTVSGVHGHHPVPMVMNPGRWWVKITNKKNLFLDYVVLLPSEYYEATILTQDVNVPCEIGQKTGLCRHYAYPTLSKFDSVKGAGGYANENNVRIPLIEYFTDRDALLEIGEKEVPLINENQQDIHFELRISKPGLHVLMLTYVTPKDTMVTSTVLIQANTIGKGKSTLNPCRYTSICRQVVVDSYSKVAVMNFSSNYVSLVSSGGNGTNVALESIVAIPLDQWSLDYVKPKSVCVRKNGKCVQGIFPDVADAKKIEFETNKEILETVDRPRGIYDNATKLIYLNNVDGTVDIHAKVPHAGEYTFIIRYYQPDHPGFDLDILVHNGKVYEAKLPIHHCPSNSGCRSVVQQIDGNTKFQLLENFVITVKNELGDGIWLDYILVVPNEQYNEKLLKKIQFDQTKEFIKKCGNNHFYVRTNETGFCRDSIFSLTANYNDRAFPCQCDIEGTNSFECEIFGGQCPCKPNIIGRRCEACRTGFYGFPYCRACNCPSTALCEPDTGACLCPPRVTGERCDQCEVGTYGFDQIIGCEECNCSPLGVINGELQCDLFNGSCACKENVHGRQCEKCRPGYSHFPHCQNCDCSIRGTTNEICDQSNAECFCKSNVQGLACDICKEGTFNLQAHNEEGCTKCFCFGKTTRCTSANLYRKRIFDMRDWKIAVSSDIKSGENLTILPGSFVPDESLVNVDFSRFNNTDNVVYFVAPQSYLGKKLTSYGGLLNYTVRYTNGQFGKAILGIDVILHGGSDTVLLHYTEEQPPSFTDFYSTVELVEANFISQNRLPATREQIMVVLEDLKGIYIRASYWHPTLTASLVSVTLEITNEQYSSYDSVAASGVEQCQCPPAYQGLSCEECAPGYYRVPSGPYGGYCVRCECHGHANTCDVNTGVCHDCKNGTIGEHCEFCEQGYYGNATIGTPSDCLICACPLPTPSNNFATSCEINEEGDKISCQCLPGYYGARCSACAAGYYGNPEVYDDYCKPCECSGNIDTNQLGACDSFTGACNLCLNNTFGEACNLCAPGYYGDAVMRKNCQSCLCDDCGMEHCDSSNGQCYCRENVVGDKCDRCADNHYGFKTCAGCRPCDCQIASDSKQCDDNNGQCMCKPGVTGRKCDQCIPGYWNYGPGGCTSCGCNTGYSVGASCNTMTGQCTCLPGVIGEKCDHCPHRHVLIPGEGCFPCVSCTDDLLDVTDHLVQLLYPISQEFNVVADSFFTHQRLKFINETVNDLSPDVKLLNPNRIDFVPLQEKITHLKEGVTSQKRKIDYAAEDSMKWKGSSENTLNDMNELEKELLREIDLVKFVVSDIDSLALNIEMGYNTQVDSSLSEAENILKQIKEVSFINFRDRATDQADQANILVSEMLEYNFPVSNLTSAATELNDKMTNVSVKLNDLMEIAQRAQELASNVDKLNRDNMIAAEGKNFDVVKNFTIEAKEDLEAGEELDRNASQHLAEAQANIAILQTNIVGDAVAQLNNTISQNDKMLLEVTIPVQQAHEHANKLYDHSLELYNLLTDTRNTFAVRAVSAYRDIVSAIETAREAAADGMNAANNATILSTGIESKILESRTKCEELLSNAEVTTVKPNSEEALRKSQALGASMKDENRRNKELLDYIDKVLSSIPSESSIVAEDAMKEATQVEYNMKDAIKNINELANKIPEDLRETKRLTKDMSESIRNISQAQNQLDTIRAITPNITNLLNNVGESQKSIDESGNDLQKKLEVLKTKVANARELANRFRVGLTFYRNTTLELKNPESLAFLATSTTLSLYFRTNATNGFLLYLGNEDKSNNLHSKTHDFVALLLESGYPVLIIDLGSGPEKIISSKFVSDNVWRQIMVERTGKNVKLIVREEIGDRNDQLFAKEQVLQSTHSIFNVDPDHSKLFVGGYPSSFQMQNTVTATSFEGEMEELVIGDTPVSLWNFVDGENNRQGAIERDKLIDYEPNVGFRFYRNGYAILSRKMSRLFGDPKKFNIRLNFKTFAEDGLIFLMSKGIQFFSLALKNGRIIYQYDLGEGEAQIRSKKKYNDGQWHNLEALRFEKTGVLEIDRVRISQVEAPGDTKTLVSTDHIYFGGYPPSNKNNYKYITNNSFEGCIDNVHILETLVDLNYNIHAFGVMPGCPVRFASLVSFEESTPGYVKWPNVSISDTLQINLKFKTVAKDGLIFYATNEDQSVTSRLSLFDGKLVFTSQGEEVQSSSAGAKFNDNEWHVVTASHKQDSLQIDIDDVENYISNYTDSRTNQLQIVSGSLYIGGLPLAIRTADDKTETSFIGCIGDATLNGVIINFINTTERPNAYLGECKGGDHSSTSGVEYDENSPPPPILPTESPEDSYESVTHTNIVDVDNRSKEKEESTPATESTSTIVPETVNECNLPYYPAVDSDIENGWRFGTTRNSRLEYRSLNGRYKDDYDFQLDVKTMADEGIIFYASNLNTPDFIALYMNEGKIQYGFDCGSGPAFLISETKINDDQWHNIVFKREENHGELYIDEKLESSGYSEGNLTTINIIPPFYVGGVLPEISNHVINKIGINKTFAGCVGNFMMNGQTVGPPTEIFGANPCSKHVEHGMFFYPGNGSNLFKAMDKFTVGRTVDIQMDIKPRTTSGHLLSVHGRRDFLVLELINGTVKFLVKTAKGTIETSFEPTKPNSLCDGNWHNIRAVKQKNAVLLSVDHKAASPGIGGKNIAGVLSKHPIFIGGHPLLGKPLRGCTSQAQYVGCISHIMINLKPIHLEPERAYGHVTASVCPTI